MISDPCGLSRGGIQHLLIGMSNFKHDKRCAGRSVMEVRNEEQTTLNRANGNLTLTCAPAPPSLLHSRVDNREEFRAFYIEVEY